MDCINCSKLIAVPSSGNSHQSDGSILFSVMEESFVFLPTRFGDVSILGGNSTIYQERERCLASINSGSNNCDLTASLLNITQHDVSQNIAFATRLASHSSGKSFTSQICNECIRSMVQMIDIEIEQAREEKRAFMALISTFSNNTKRSTESVQVEEELSSYMNELKLLESNLQLMDKEVENIRSELGEIVEKNKEICQLEEELWLAISEYEQYQTDFRDDRDSGFAKIRKVQLEEDELRGCNVLNEMFHIWHDGAFGTINGFRFGQLASQQVDWNEINAAWGETALLTVKIVKKMGFTFDRYKIIPIGNFSKVKRLHGPEMQYNLHGSGQDNFIESRFNLGMTAWLDCLKQLGDHVEGKDRSMRLPYRIEGNRIGGLSIQFLRNDEKWTKSLKFCLTNLKWLLAWCSKEGNAK